MARSWLLARYGVPTETPLPAVFESEDGIQEADEGLVERIEDLTKVQGEPSCLVCRKIISILHGEHHEYYVHLGHPADLLWSKCEFHPRIIAHLLSNIEEPTTTLSGHNIYVKSGDSPTSLQLFHKRSYAEWYELMEYSHLGNTKGFGRSINPDWVNLDQLATWERYCTYLHGENCRLPTHLNNKFSIRLGMLIDTHEMCLTKSEGTETYVALSYVWGVVPMLKTTIANLHSLQQPGVLAHAIAKLQIPLTIVNAIYITQKLGMRYLWVDALCIVQDDDTIRDYQIQNMGSIFANGSLTVIAAEGEHSNHGISGIRDLSHPRQLTQDIFALPNGIRVCHVPSVYNMATKWDTRGWTYQEEFFSSRSLIFGRSRVSWKCRNSELREDLEIDRPSIPIPQGMGSLENFIGNSWPDLVSYAIACGEWDNMSWDCATEFVKIDYLGYYKLTNVRTINILDWYTGSAEASHGQRRKIPLTWRKYAYLFDNDTDPVPPGWTRYPFDPRTLSDAAKQGAPDKLSVTTIFKHDSDNRSEFWWPVPTAVEHTAANLGFTVLATWNCRVPEHLSEIIAMDALLKFNKALFTGHSLELVAISRGYALLHRVSLNKMGLDELSLSEHPKVSDVYECYNVLWIKWENGVAYRHGLGRVLKSVWEAQGLETVEVVLG
ncbi:HET domain containing protein [Hyaloscypha variabilis]